MKRAASKAPTRAKSAPKEARRATTRVTVVSITPSRDGRSWTIVLSDARRVRVSSAAAHAVRAKVGMAWSDALRARIDEADSAKRAFSRALAILAKEPTISRARLLARLGGDERARRAVREVAASGWL